MRTSKFNTMPLAKKYPYIVAWGKMLGSFESYIEDHLITAELEQAPATAIYSMAEGGWKTISDVTNEHTAEYCRSYVKENFPDFEN
jgi:hypothetical protein